ncbi:MAG: biotin--[acetyl-CoA-carboxylase] ligase [Firmicutes bacterium]|nr:biotin--[acetyl-CoA-carboxylase] ligase [Bacillota bacterium]
MKEILLAELKRQLGRYVSGEELSQRLGVTRTAVWKQIQALREEGYGIEALPRLGYRLLVAPDLLLPAEIQGGLATSVLGRKVYHYRETDSTNRLARELGSRGEPEGTLVVAERQQAGRGRLDRKWFSPAGGIWLSLLLRPQLFPHQAQLLTLVAAVAAVEATEAVSGLVPGIKWPNDLLLAGSKLAGILTEVSAEIDLVHYLVLGVGVNANIPADAFPAELRETATSMLAVLGQPVNRAAWVRQFLQYFEKHYLVVGSSGFDDLLARWRRYSVTLGHEVTVYLPGRQVSGTAIDIDDHGALQVRTEAGIETFPAGEIRLRDKGDR